PLLQLVTQTEPKPAARLNGRCPTGMRLGAGGADAWAVAASSTAARRGSAASAFMRIAHRPRRTPRGERLERPLRPGERGAHVLDPLLQRQQPVEVAVVVVERRPRLDLPQHGEPLHGPVAAAAQVLLDRVRLLVPRTEQLELQDAALLPARDHDR